jgi:hypothetical protein
VDVPTVRAHGTGGVMDVVLLVAIPVVGVLLAGLIGDRISR